MTRKGLHASFPTFDKFLKNGRLAATPLSFLHLFAEAS
jgi:hypothetical protein